MGRGLYIGFYEKGHCIEHERLSYALCVQLWFSRFGLTTLKAPRKLAICGGGQRVRY